MLTAAPRCPLDLPILENPYSEQERAPQQHREKRRQTVPMNVHLAVRPIQFVRDLLRGLPRQHSSFGGFARVGVNFV
jgi:hypothetical protein